MYFCLFVVVCEFRHIEIKDIDWKALLLLYGYRPIIYNSDLWKNVCRDH